MDEAGLKLLVDALFDGKNFSSVRRNYFNWELVERNRELVGIREKETGSRFLNVIDT